MLLKIGDLIINTDQLILAEWTESDHVLYVRLAGGGSGDTTYSSRELEGDEAKAVWKVLCGESKEIDASHPSGLKRQPTSAAEFRQ